MPGGFGSATSPVDGGYNPLTLTTQLATGDRVGSYQIVSPLGAGGMGEVFRARDTRLNREVAIKILPPAFADDPDRLARFTREAQTLAALNHPNIAQIHGFEESSASAGGVRALVMELVPGEDLSTMTGRGPLSIPDALSIARQIADALEAAHEQGIIHRDLKPGNVKVRPDGTIKVLDFGLAKALAPEAAGGVVDAMHSPTLTQRAIYVVSTNGTLAYVAGGPARYAQRVVWVDRAGPVEALPLPERDYEAVQHGSRPTGSGLPTSQRSLGPSRSTSCRFRVQAPEFRSPPAAATVRCGRRMVASCIT